MTNIIIARLTKNYLQRFADTEALKVNYNNKMVDISDAVRSINRKINSGKLNIKKLDALEIKQDYINKRREDNSITLDDVFQQYFTGELESQIDDTALLNKFSDTRVHFTIKNKDLDKLNLQDIQLKERLDGAKSSLPITDTIGNICNKFNLDIKSTYNAYQQAIDDNYNLDLDVFIKHCVLVQGDLNNLDLDKITTFKKERVLNKKNIRHGNIITINGIDYPDIVSALKANGFGEKEKISIDNYMRNGRGPAFLASLGYRRPNNVPQYIKDQLDDLDNPRDLNKIEEDFYKSHMWEFLINFLLEHPNYFTSKAKTSRKAITLSDGQTWKSYNAASEAIAQQIGVTKNDINNFVNKYLNRNNLDKSPESQAEALDAALDNYDAMLEQFEQQKQKAKELRKQQKQQERELKKQQQEKK